MLGLVEAYEQGRWDTVDALASSIGIGAATLSSLYLEALAWASDHQGSNEGLRQPAEPTKWTDGLSKCVAGG